MKINWLGARGRFSLNDLHTMEIEKDIKFPQGYVDLVSSENGASPDKKIFDCAARNDCVFDSLINWDKSRKANMFFWAEVINLSKIVPFAQDPFGNLICFDYSYGPRPKIVFWEHEADYTLPVADSFDCFLDNLRK